MLAISCSGIMAHPKNCWPFDYDVSFDQAKRELVIDPSKPIPSHLVPKDLPFESRVIAYIIATTLLPRLDLTLRSLSMTPCLLTTLSLALKCIFRPSSSLL